MKAYLILPVISLVACTTTPPPMICDREAQVWSKYETAEDACEVVAAPIAANQNVLFGASERSSKPSRSRGSLGNPASDITATDQVSEDVIEESGFLDSESSGSEAEPVVTTPVVEQPDPVVVEQPDPVETTTPVVAEPAEETMAPVVTEPADTTTAPIVTESDVESSTSVEPEPEDPVAPVVPKPIKPAPPPGFDG